MAEGLDPNTGRPWELCPDCEQPMLPAGVTKRPNEYDHASGCPREPRAAGFECKCLCHKCNLYVTYRDGERVEHPPTHCNRDRCQMRPPSGPSSSDPAVKP